MSSVTELETITGIIRQVAFHNEDDGWVVLRAEIEDDLCTVVGHLPIVREGEHFRGVGRWVDDRNYGIQFRAEHLLLVPPDTREGIVRYLGSGMVKGIGPRYARRLVDAFGERLFEVIENEPARLAAVRGIGKAKAKRIAETWHEQKAVRETMIYLHEHGISTPQAVRIFKTYGDKTVQTIAHDPYALVRDVRGIGFRTADAIAAKLGLASDSPLRARAGALHVISEAEREGHCGLPVDEFFESAEQILDIPRTVIAEALPRLMRLQLVVEGTIDGEEALFSGRLLRSEQRIATALKRLQTGPPPWKGSVSPDAVENAASAAGLSTSQRQALEMVLSSKVSVITGGPGVGKTTLVRTILEILEELEIRLSAPTGRAAKRLAESSGWPASTIHRLLEVNAHLGVFTRDEHNPLECDLVIVDEASMIDVPLMDSLLNAMPPQAALILVGDVDQLPSVGPGNVLGDVIESGAVPVAHLTEIFRQARDSGIVINAHRINAGEQPDLRGAAEDFFFSSVSEGKRVVERIVQIVCERIPLKFGLDPRKDVQVLVPMHRGDVGTISLNQALQRRLNPAAAGGQGSFHAGDKVMQIENDYDKEVYNGDIGFVTYIDAERKTLAVDYDGHQVSYDFDDIDKLVLAYAISIHKSQGSEYPAVVIALTTQHHVMLQRKLLYTAITRGRKLVVIVGDERAVRTSVASRSTRKRWTLLREFLTPM